MGAGLIVVSVALFVGTGADEALGLVVELDDRSCEVDCESRLLSGVGAGAVVVFELMGEDVNVGTPLTLDMMSGGNLLEEGSLRARYNLCHADTRDEDIFIVKSESVLVPRMAKKSRYIPSSGRCPETSEGV